MVRDQMHSIDSRLISSNAAVPRRNACYGSAEVSYPVLLPLLAQLPRALLGASQALLAQVLS